MPSTPPLKVCQAEFAFLNRDFSDGWPTFHAFSFPHDKRGAPDILDGDTQQYKVWEGRATRPMAASGRWHSAFTAMIFSLSNRLTAGYSRKLPGALAGTSSGGIC